MKYADLHIHSMYSDGTNRPDQIVRDCALIGDEVIAITDHDTTRGYEPAREAAKKWDVEVVPGVEISTKVYHILGYGFEVENKELQTLLTRSRGYQEDIAKKRIEKLRQEGVPITFEKVKQYFPKSRLGKMNIHMTLIRDKEGREYFKGKSLEEIYETCLGKEGIAKKVEEEEYVETEEAIKVIHQAGGIAILAHPFKQIKIIEELEELVKKGIDGIEIQPDFKEKNELFKKYAQEHGLIITYGSDYHGACLERELLRRNGNQVENFWRQTNDKQR